MSAAVQAGQADPALAELKAAHRIIFNALASMPTGSMPTWRRLNAADGVIGSRGVARHLEREAVIQAAEGDEIPGKAACALLLATVPEPVQDLMSFYDAKTTVDLIYAMEKHIAGLQDRLRQATPGANFFPQLVRAG
ncbi:hypothetical protein OTERR_12650 [Oryzomicrobium terrae]|uniref:Uncharacterized protein n=1 Tax=Oryzomicrobium terrae TaxID=1735038 RepID=A0A5C1E738_9RHOO|nr:hypothetical protein [Oryzomicrobium terrae]QEL64741.1 hypothetical protein OTERR_12650 [Oryzomicrobium terrae]